MRYLLCLMALILFSTQDSVAQKKLLYGSWKVVTIDGEAPTGKDAGMELIFMKNGSFEIKERGKSINGTWELSADEKRIDVTIGDEQDVEVISIVEQGKKSMKLDNHGSVAEFAKTGKAPKVKKPKKIKGAAKKVAATWQITAVNGMSLEGDDMPITIIQLNEDGSAWSSIIGEGGEIGTWKLTDDSKQIVINFNGEEKPANFILSDNDNVMELSDNGAVIRMKRIESKIEKPAPYEAPWEDPIEPEGPDKNLDDPSFLIGDWVVVSIDDDLLEGRELKFSIKADNTFSISDNGEVEREGSWEIKKNRFFIKDQNGYSSDYAAMPGTTGVLFLEDYYGKMKLEKK